MRRQKHKTRAGRAVRRYFVPGPKLKKGEYIIRPVDHPEIDFISKHGQYLGELDVVRDDVVAVQTPKGRLIRFQADGAGCLRFFCVVRDFKECIAARGVPSRMITDFEPGEVKVKSHV